MFQRRPESFELLRKALSAYIIEEGSQLVADEKLRNEDLVTKLIELNQRILGIMQQLMTWDSRIDLTIKMSFEKVVNVNMRTAKSLVFYIDEMFKKELRSI